MKKVNEIVCLVLCVALLFGCTTTRTLNSDGTVTEKKKISNTAGGGILGGAGGAALGAGLGAIFGGKKGAAWGAGIGAAVGGGAGVLIGNKMDKQRKELEKIQNAQVESIDDGKIIKVTFDSGILFATNSSSLNQTSKTSLSQFAASLQANVDTDVLVTGHTDSSGGDQINVPLSEKRAESVKNFLTSQGGILSSRIETQGFGSSQKVAEESAKGVQALNRRVDIYIVPSKKMVDAANEGTLK
ncbi:MAG: OmpA family protein [Dysgonamonadaceae bacterium]|jgi:outer membrane protein OmpA-like peptidoglycan-associated protein|nr:OmpA family protein [Dysgonamonadaceae bacterium]